MPLPPSLDSFRSLANSTSFSSRDIVVSGNDRNATAKLGNFVFSHGKTVNNATMAAFKAALENEYGVFGTNAFDTILGNRNAMHKSLRAMDVRQTLSALPQLRQKHFMSEINRQLDTSPRILELPQDAKDKVLQRLSNDTLDNVYLVTCKTIDDISAAAQKRIDKAIEDVRAEESGINVAKTLGDRTEVEGAVLPNEATGLRNIRTGGDLRTDFTKGETSVADLVKKGLAGAGMRVNSSETNPVLFDKLKTNGVEPGFIYRNDWSKDDTRGFMADIDSPESHTALDALKARDPAFAAKCEGKSHREQVMLAGRAHPAGMAAVAEFAIQNAAQEVISGKGHIPEGYVFRALADGIKRQFADFDIQKLANGTAGKALLKEAKLWLFPQIRDGVMNVGPKDDFHGLSPIFKHFSERSIVKLDYNEGDKFSGGKAANAGTFMRPERILTTRKPVLGQIYRFTSRQSADTISAGAVTEALANDLTRLAGIPAQELEIVRGQYSDGHPKLMLAAKFANGYKDMENGMIKDGRAIPPRDENGNPGPEPEPLGKYKAFFLLTADRDAIGKRGQNKGFINGRFFAIDPGHSLEGNGKFLDISDDFSFKDTFKGGIVKKPRFNNFSVFDDDTRFAKLSGLIELRRIAASGAFADVFNNYKAAFNPDAPGITPAEKELRQKICTDIDAKKAEFDKQLSRLFDIFDMQLRLNDSLAAEGPATQEKAVNTLSHLEMLTSPTTWVSKKGQVALKHLEVRPETRVPWRAGVDGDNLVYHCDKPLDGSTVKLLQGLAKNAGASFSYDNYGSTTISIPKAQAEHFFAVFSEENVQKLTHPDEYAARKSGDDSLKVATDYKPVTYKHVSDPRPPLTTAQLPDQLDVIVDGRIVNMPKIHYERMATAVSEIGRPRSVDELRSSLNARIQRGTDILRALRSGDLSRFEPSQKNIVSLTVALHAKALAKGEFMYRGSFSVADPDGNIARWLDRAEGIYLRTSTHAQPMHSLTVDGHLNMPRGYDVPEGMGGLLNGMRTFHYFTLPDPDHLKDAGGSGPKRRLFLKCETFGIFCSTAIFKTGKKAEATSEGMNTRGYKFGDVLESIFHGSSLLASFFTPKEVNGIRKENLLTAQKEVIDVAEANLRAIGEDKLADILTRAVKGRGAGIRQVMDNITAVVNNLPEDENKRAEVTEILDDLVAELGRVSGNLPGELVQRMGNEIMID